MIFLKCSMVFGQSCCSGGAPIFSNLGLPGGESNVWQFQLSYDINSLRTLKSGVHTFDNDNIRTTKSILFELGYGISDKISVDGLFSFVRQERTTISTEGSTSGPGDIAILFRYKPFKFIRIGYGLKIPIGKYDMKNDTGITYTADFQPGTGAWDNIFWANFSNQLKIRPSMNFSIITFYRLTGDNTDYLGSSTFKFGNEFQTIIALSDKVFVKKIIIDPVISIKFRNTGQYEFDGVEFPNTGGNWIFLSTGLGFNVTPDLSLLVNGEIPLYANVIGIQLSPTYRLKFGVYYAFSNKEKSFGIQPLKDN